MQLVAQTVPVAGNVQSAVKGCTCFGYYTADKQRLYATSIRPTDKDSHCSRHISEEERATVVVIVQLADLPVADTVRQKGKTRPKRTSTAVYPVFKKQNHFHIFCINIKSRTLIS